MKYILFLLLFSSMIAKAQDTTHTIATSKLNALLGTTRLKAAEPVNTDKALVNFLEQHPNFEQKREGEKENRRTIYQYKEQGVFIKTKKTGIGIPSLDDFVETVIIKTAPKRPLPYNTHTDMSCKEFYKSLKLLDFKYNRSKRQKTMKILRKEVFESETVTVELYFKKNDFTKMVLIANLDAMYGGLLIEE